MWLSIEFGVGFRIGQCQWFRIDIEAVQVAVIAAVEMEVDSQLQAAVIAAVEMEVSQLHVACSMSSF